MNVEEYRRNVFPWDINTPSQNNWNEPCENHSAKAIDKLLELTKDYKHVHLIRTPSIMFTYDLARDKPINKPSDLDIYKSDKQGFFLVGEIKLVKTQIFDSIGEVRDMFSHNDDTIFMVYDLKKRRMEIADEDKIFIRYSKFKKPITIKRHNIMEKQYRVISRYCGTQVNDEVYNEEDADILIKELNSDVEELGFPEVKYDKVLVGESE